MNDIDITEETLDRVKIPRTYDVRDCVSRQARITVEMNDDDSKEIVVSKICDKVAEVIHGEFSEVYKISLLKIKENLYGVVVRGILSS